MPLSPPVNRLAVAVLRAVVESGELSSDEFGEFTGWLCAVAAGLESQRWDEDPDAPEGWA